MTLHHRLGRLIDAFRPAEGPPPATLLAFFRWCLSGAWGGLTLAGIASALGGVADVVAAVLLGWVVDAIATGDPGAFWGQNGLLVAAFVGFSATQMLRDRKPVPTRQLPGTPGRQHRVMTQFRRLTLGAAFLSGALLLASCGGGETPAQPEPEKPTPTGTAEIIQGQIKPYEGTPTSVSVPLLNQSAVDGLKITQAPVDSAGLFTLRLPDAAVIDQSEDLQTPGEAFGGGNCSEDTVTAPQNLRVFPIYALEGNNGKQYIDKLDDGQGDAAVTRLRVYSTAEGRVLLNGPCLLGTISGDLSLKRGWNVVEGTFTGNTSSFKVVDAPANTATFVERGINAGSLSKLSLPTNIFEPWKSLPRYQNR